MARRKIEPREPHKALQERVKSFALAYADENLLGANLHEWRDLIEEQPKDGTEPITNEAFLASISVPEFLAETISVVYKNDPKKQEKYKKLPENFSKWVDSTIVASAKIKQYDPHHEVYLDIYLGQGLGLLQEIQDILNDKLIQSEATLKSLKEMGRDAWEASRASGNYSSDKIKDEMQISKYLLEFEAMQMRARGLSDEQIAELQGGKAPLDPDYGSAISWASERLHFDKLDAAAMQKVIADYRKMVDPYIAKGNDLTP